VRIEHSHEFRECKEGATKMTMSKPLSGRR